MQKAVLLAHFLGTLLLKEQMMISVKKNLMFKQKNKM